MTCPANDFEIKRLLNYISENSKTYNEWVNYYQTSTAQTSTSVIESALGTTTSFARVSGTNLQVNGTVLTMNVPFSANQNVPYLIAGTPNYTGATTNWGTFGFQHKIKTDGSNVPRLTIDRTNNFTAVEAFTLKGDNGFVGIGTSNPTNRLHVDGSVTLTSAITSTGANAGTQTLPANPLGFLFLNINGVACKIPYYAN